MSIERRELLLSSLPFGVGLLFEPGFRSLAAEPDVQNAVFDEDTYNFWTSQVTRPSQAFEQHGRIVSERGPNLLNEAGFVFYSKETGFVRAASTETDAPLTTTMLPKGDASLLLAVDTIRPSGEHLKKIWEHKNGSLRIDLKQAVPLQQLSETLNWSAIASLVPGERPFAGYHEIAFDPKSTWGQAKKVPLTGGIGFWSWNFSTQPKPSIWTEVMGMLGDRSSSWSNLSEGDDESRPQGKKKPEKNRGQKHLRPGTAGYSPNRTGCLQSALRLDVFKWQSQKRVDYSQRGHAFAGDARSAPKASRTRGCLAFRAYLVFDGQHRQELLSGKYELRDGLVVPMNTKEGDLEQVAQETLPELSYIALSAVVEPIA